MGIELNNDQIYAVYDLDNWWTKANDQVFEISGAAGTGKAQPIDTLIPTPDGEKKLGDLKKGNYVFNRYGKPVKILGVYDQGEKDAFKVTFSDGRSTICNDEHLWTCIELGKDKKTLTLRQILDRGFKTHNGKLKYAIPQSKGVYYSTKKFKVHPYDMGQMIINRDMTRIPNEYFYGDEQQRVELLQGILDVGFICLFNKDNKMEFISSIKELVKDVKSVFNSLGYSSSFKECTISAGNAKFVEYRLILDIPGIEILRFFKNRDIDETFVELNGSKEVYDRIYISDIENLGYKTEMRCIYIDDPEHLYLTNDYIVTHNTTLIRYFIDRLGLSYDNVMFVAFMGKAASQMARTGLPARTIHSAIYEYSEKIARDDDGKIIFKENGKPKLVPYFKLKDKLSKKIKLIVLDEGSMVDEKTAKDLLSFGVPVIVLGDLNQLPPVFGNPYFLNEPNVILKQIMRQAEGNPIIWLSQQVLADKELKFGVYGNSAVIPKKDITEFQFRSSDIILTGTNRLRYNINTYCREELKQIKNLDYPHVGEKVICRKNNWDLSIGDGIYLTNGTTGYVDGINRRSFNGKTMEMDFRPDFSKKIFKNITFDWNHMYAIPGYENNIETPFGYMYDKFEYAYAITVHSSQGSQWPNVTYMHEDFMRNPVDRKKLMYTAITRASDRITIVK